MKIFDSKSQKFLGLRVSAIFETFCFLIVATALQLFFLSPTYFSTTLLHPFWIIVLLVTVQYGTAEGIFAAIASSVFLYLLSFPSQKAEEAYFDYQLRIALLPSLWFITAFILGEIRMRIEKENETLRSRLDQARSEVEKITAEYLVLKEANQNLEFHLSAQEETAATGFRVFRALEALEPAQIIFGLNEIIEKTLHPDKFSVFAKGPNGLEAVTSKGWKPSDNYVRRFVPSSPLFEAVVNDKKMISIVNKDERKILHSEGVLATPLIHPDSGEVFGMIKVEELDFKTLSLSRLETFKVVADLIGRAYSNAKKHHTSLQFNLFAIPGLLYSYPLYKMASSYFKMIAETEKSLVNSLSLKLENNAPFEENKLVEWIKTLPPFIKCFEGSKKLKELFLIYPKSYKSVESHIKQLEKVCEQPLLVEKDET